MDQTQPFLFIFCPFLNTVTNVVQNLTIKSVDAVLGIRTWDSKIVGADDSTELWWHP